MRLAPFSSFCLVAVLLAPAGLVCAQETPVSPISEVRALSAKDAESARTVRVQGVVTYITPNGLVFFLQDETGGIFVGGPRERPLRGELKLGVWAEIEGVTAMGRMLPYITARKKEPIRVLQTGEGQLPSAREATIAQLQQPEFQAIRVEVSGVVRTVQTEPFGQAALDTLLITLVDENHRLVVALPGWRGASPPTHLVGAHVRARGIFNTSVLERQALFANRLLISGMKDFQVEEPALPPFEAPAVPIESARAAADDPGDAVRTRLQGTVTVSVPGKGFFLEDESAALFVAATPVPPNGERVEVAGFPGMRDGGPLLEDSIWRKANHSISVQPPLVTPESALTGAMDGRLVQIEALLLAISSAGDGPSLVLQGGERVFLARCANTALRLPALGENSWLRVTGVCVNTRSPQLRDAAGGQSESFHLLLAGPQSVQIARTPSWWTLRRVMMLVGSFAALTCAAIVWATTLRRRVTQQTSQIREHLAREAVAEERLRIARELHDSVQQDLLGITMQIKATERLLEADAEKARSALNLASAMVRRSQAETHRAVWDLRESAHEDSDLVTSLTEMLSGLSMDEGAKVDLICTGERRGLPAAIESQLLRVAQEAMTNALKHAEATRIEVELRFAEDRLTMIVRDDGRGFDADHPPSASTGHFGLYGMRERAIKLEADLRVTSRPGEGTAIQIDVPLASFNIQLKSEPTPSGLRLVPRPSIS
jgi:signal transduction histidine kinase